VKVKWVKPDIENIK